MKLQAALRCWLVLVLAAALDGALCFMHFRYREYDPQSWWASDQALGASLAIPTLAGLAWCWYREQAIRVRVVETIGLSGLALACTMLRMSSPPLPEAPPTAIEVLWTYEQLERGAIISTPLVEKDRIYVGAIRDSGFNPAGVVCCLDRKSGKVVWQFDDQGQMIHMYSSPCLADGRLFIGEGMHANLTCQLYCLDADSGKLLWQFAAAGHIESSPCYAAGKVYFGAGDDGIYCLEAATGKPCWHFRGPVHLDSTVALVGKRLYAGSGVSRAHRQTEVFCLDSANGNVFWRTPIDLPAWGSPVVDGDRLFLGLGNGRLTQSAEEPRGAILCLNAEDGKECWRHDVMDAVMIRPTLGTSRVYAGARDGFCYALDRRDGKLCWKEYLGSPVVTRPALVDQRLYVVATEGTVCCLDAETGKRQWTFECAPYWRTRPQMLSSPVVLAHPPEDPGHRRIYLGGEFRSPLNSAAVLFCLRE